MKPTKSGVTVAFNYDKWFEAHTGHDNDVVKVIRCKDCARNDNCFMYRESGNDEGYCAWADRREE